MIIDKVATNLSYELELLTSIFAKVKKIQKKSHFILALGFSHRPLVKPIFCHQIRKGFAQNHPAPFVNVKITEREEVCVCVRACSGEDVILFIIVIRPHSTLG